MAIFFEDLDNDQSAGSDNNKPFFMVDRENEGALIDWFTKTMAFLKEHNQQRLNEVKNNYARYKGIQYREQVFQPRDLPEKRIRYMPQMVVPLISDAVDEKVARLLEYKPSIVCIPQNDEQQDKIAAKTAKKFLSHIEQVDDLDIKFRKAVKSSKIAGESFVFVLWDTGKGEVILPSGKSITMKDGKIIKGPIYQGEASNVNATALDVLYEAAKDWDHVEYIFYFDHEYTEKLRHDYPEKKDQIQPNKATTYYDFESMDMKSLEGMSSLVTFYHKKTKYLPDGFECKFTDKVILKKGALPYEHGDLPVVRFIDIENEEELSGESFIKKTRSLASQYNNNRNMIIKQHMLCSNPKWFIDGGSTDDQSLGNDVTIVKLKPGSRQPVLAQANPVSPQLIEFSQELKNEFYEMVKSNSVVRGEPPPGVTAFVALQFVSESENRRISSDVANVNKSILNVYEMNLKVCAQYYKKEDKRTMMIMGKDNRWNYAFLDPAQLAKPFTLKMQNSSALPESKALRTQFVLDMGKTFPEQFPPSQVAEMLDLGQSEKLLDVAGMAARCAEDENEMILDGSAIPDPEPHEDLITHWRVHLSAIQDVGFKMKTDENIQKAMYDHILATEMLMVDQATRSPSFAQKLMVECPQFPSLYTVPPPPMMPPPMPGQEGQAGVDFKAAPKVKPMPGDDAFSQVEAPGSTGASSIPEGVI